MQTAAREESSLISRELFEKAVSLDSTDRNNERKPLQITLCFFLSTILWFSCSSFSAFHLVLAQEALRSPKLTDSKLQALLDKASACSLSYYRQFRQFVAEEKQVQKRYDRNGDVVEQRTIISDYYVVSLPSNPEEAIEFREAISVNDKIIPRDPLRLNRLLNRKSSDLESEIQRINKESNRYYIANKGLGDLANTWYRYASLECRDHAAYQLLQADSPEEVTVLQFQESGHETFIHFRDLFGRTTPIPASGSYHLSGPEGRLVKVDITVFWGAERSYSIGRWVKEYKTGPEGAMLPSCFRTVLYQGHSAKYFLETESTYSNFRRFTTDVKLMTSELLEASE
jgi:hypothetical protein